MIFNINTTKIFSLNILLSENIKTSSVRWIKVCTTFQGIIDVNFPHLINNEDINNKIHFFVDVLWRLHSQYNAL